MELASRPHAPAAPAHAPALSALSREDAALVTAVAHRLAAPRLGPVTSFQLHAPLELMARAALLPLVPPLRLAAARQRLAALGKRFQATGPGVPRPEPSPQPLAPHQLAAALTAALTTADADAVDLALVSALHHLPPRELLAQLPPLLVDSLGAAAHAPILVAELRDLAAAEPAAHAVPLAPLLELLRAPLRTLARTSHALRWHRALNAHQAALAPQDAEALLQQRLRAPRRLTSPSSFIAPTMLTVERAGLAAELLANLVPALTSRGAERALSRLAAHAMLQEPADHARYGWTHCLTLPQAVLRLARGTTEEPASIAVAATYVLGFRATLGQVALAPETPLASADPDEMPMRWRALIGAAAAHDDAHFVKYVRAVLDARAADPDGESLYLAAGERLAALWEQTS